MLDTSISSFEHQLNPKYIAPSKKNQAIHYSESKRSLSTTSSRLISNSIISQSLDCVSWHPNLAPCFASALHPRLECRPLLSPDSPVSVKISPLKMFVSLSFLSASFSSLLFFDPDSPLYVCFSGEREQKCVRVCVCVPILQKETNPLVPERERERGTGVIRVSFPVFLFGPTFFSVCGYCELFEVFIFVSSFYPSPCGIMGCR